MVRKDYYGFSPATKLLLSFFLLAVLLLSSGNGPLSPDKETEHVVKQGETIGGIADRAKVPRILIVETNHLQEPYTLRAGQTLIIPRTRKHTVAKGETGFTIAYRYGVEWSDIAIANGMDPASAVKPGQSLLIPTMASSTSDALSTEALSNESGPTIPTSPPAAAMRNGSPSASQSASAKAPSALSGLAWPIAGELRRGFVSAAAGKDQHDGLDIAVPDGTAVRASAAGKVAFAGTEPKQFGQLVIIDHGQGLSSAYAFLSRITVKEGEDVRQGERIGLSGHSGKARGSELHFEVRRNQRPVDPVPLLPVRN